MSADPWGNFADDPPHSTNPRLAPALAELLTTDPPSRASQCFSMVGQSVQPLREAAISAYRLRCIGEGRRGPFSGEHKVAFAVQATAAYWTAGRPSRQVIAMGATDDVLDAYDASDPAALAVALGAWLEAVVRCIAAGGVAREVN